MSFDTESVLYGTITNVSHVEVTRLVPGREIELVSESGRVLFRALYTLVDDVSTTELICTLRFEFDHLILDMARPAIEGLARNRLKRDLLTLRRSLVPAR